jgi:arylsulfatase A
LYDLKEDVGEEHNFYDANPDVVADLMAALDAARADLGDAITGAAGTGRREAGRVENPKPLATYNESHPYIVACYDMPDTAVMGG